MEIKKEDLQFIAQQTIANLYAPRDEEAKRVLDAGVSGLEAQLELAYDANPELVEKLARENSSFFHSLRTFAAKHVEGERALGYIDQNTKHYIPMKGCEGMTLEDMKATVEEKRGWKANFYSLTKTSLGLTAAVMSVPGLLLAVPTGMWVGKKVLGNGVGAGPALASAAIGVAAGGVVAAGTTGAIALGLYQFSPTVAAVYGGTAAIAATGWGMASMKGSRTRTTLRLLDRLASNQEGTVEAANNLLNYKA